MINLINQLQAAMEQQREYCNLQLDKLKTNMHNKVNELLEQNLRTNINNATSIDLNHIRHQAKLIDQLFPQGDLSGLKTLLQNIQMQSEVVKQMVGEYMNLISDGLNQFVKQMVTTLQFINCQMDTQQIDHQIRQLYLDNLHPAKHLSLLKYGQMSRLVINQEPNHIVRDYVNVFNPTEATVNRVIQVGDSFVSGGWDGKLIKFNQHQVLYEVQAHNWPIQHIRLLVNNLILSVDQHHNWKLFNTELQDIDEGQFEFPTVSIVKIIDSYQQNVHDIVVVFENGMIIQGSGLNLHKAQKTQLNLQSGTILDVDESMSNLIVSDRFNDQAGEYHLMSIKSGELVDKQSIRCGNHHIHMARFSPNGTYAIDLQHNLYLNGNKMEGCVADYILVHEDMIIVANENNIVVRNPNNRQQVVSKIEKVNEVTINDNGLIVVIGSGVVNVEIWQMVKAD